MDARILGIMPHNANRSFTIIAKQRDMSLLIAQGGHKIVPLGPYHANTAADTSCDTASASIISSQAPASISTSITPELIQQMIVNAFSALGISCNHQSLS